MARWLVLLAEILRPAAESPPVPGGAAVGSRNEQWLALVRDRAPELLTGGGIRAGGAVVDGPGEVVPAPAVTPTGAPVRPARGVWPGRRTGVPVSPSAASVLRRALRRPLVRLARRVDDTGRQGPSFATKVSAAHTGEGVPEAPGPRLARLNSTVASSFPAPGESATESMAANFGARGRPSVRSAPSYPLGRDRARSAPEPSFDPPGTPSPGVPLFDEPRSPVFGPPWFPEAGAVSVSAAVFDAPQPDRWPDLPDDSAQWTAPRTAFDRDHLRRLDDEQRGR